MAKVFTVVKEAYFVDDKGHRISEDVLNKGGLAGTTIERNCVECGGVKRFTFEKIAGSDGNLVTRENSQGLE